MKKPFKFLFIGALALGCVPMTLAIAQQVGEAKIANAENITIVLDMDGKAENITFSDVEDDQSIMELIEDAFRDGMICETDTEYLYSFIDRSPNTFESEDDLIDYAEYYRGLLYEWEVRAKSDATFYSVWLEIEQDYIFDKPTPFKLDKNDYTLIPTASIYGGNAYFLDGRYKNLRITYEFSPLINAADDSNYTFIDTFYADDYYSFGIVDSSEINLFDVNDEASNNTPFYEYGGETFNFLFIDSYGYADEFTDYGTLPDNTVVVLKRGSTTFSDKVKEAFNNGAAGLIVINNQPGKIGMAVGEYTGGKPIASALVEAADYFKSAGTKSTINGVDYYKGTFEIGEGTKQYYYPISEFNLNCNEFSPTRLGGDGTYDINNLVCKLRDDSVIDDDAVYYSDLTITIESMNENFEVTETKDFTVTAYLKSENMYTVTFIANGGTGEQDDNGCLFDEGSIYTLPECKFKPVYGMVFDYWEINGAEYQPGDEIIIDENKTIIAHWKSIDGGGEEGDEGGEEGEPKDTPTDSTKKGLPAGAIVGIVVGSVLIAGLGGFAIFWFVIKKKSFKDLIAVFKKKQ